MEVRLWHEFARYISLIAAKTTEGRSLFAPGLFIANIHGTNVPISRSTLQMVDKEFGDLMSNERPATDSRVLTSSISETRRSN